MRSPASISDLAPCIFDFDAERAEFGAQAVGLLPLFGGAGSGAGLEQGLFGGGQRVFAQGLRFQVEAQHRVPGEQQGQGGVGADPGGWLRPPVPRRLLGRGAYSGRR